MRVLAFAASLRTGSTNRQLIEVAAAIARREQVDVEVAEFRSFDTPNFDGDVEAASGLPPGALALMDRVIDADALIIASPEYNYSIGGPLKNAIDWVSRVRPMPWRGKSVYLMSASPSPMGGIRGLWQTRIPLEGCGSLVFPDMFALAHASSAFDGDRLKDPKLQARLEQELVGFLRLAEAVMPICEHPTSAAGEARRKKIAVALEDQTEIQPRGTAAASH